MSDAKRCPICGKPAVAEFRPFCSRRCADIDLGRWFSEDYRVPAESEEEPEKKSGREDGLPA
jgi:endogenous inhibitor of DNA gyrase (YacG/DUF329 family)